MSERILLVEPYMIGLAGHSEGAASRLATELVGLGADVRVLSSARAPVESWRAPCELRTAWPQPPSIGEGRWAGHRLASRARNLLVVSAYVRRAGAVLKRQCPDFAADTIVMLTTDASEFWALARAGLRVPVIACAHAPLPDRKISVAAKKALRRAISEGLPLSITTFTEESRAAFEQDLPGVKPIVIPYPHATADPPVERAPREGREFTISYLGDARTDKGFEFLARAIGELSPSTKFVVQCNESVAGFFGTEIPASIESLRVLSARSGRVTLLENPLSNPDYRATIARSDALVLPYDPAYYQKGRISGVLRDAWAAGVPVLITAGWGDAEETRSAGAGVLFEYGDIRSLSDAVDTLRREYAAYRRGAVRAGRRMAEENPARGSAKAILDVIRANASTPTKP